MIETILYNIAVVLLCLNFVFLLLAAISALMEGMGEKIVWCFALASWIYGCVVFNNSNNPNDYLFALSQAVCFWLCWKAFFSELRFLPRGEPTVYYYSKDE